MLPKRKLAMDSIPDEQEYFAYKKRYLYLKNLLKELTPARLLYEKSRRVLFASYRYPPFEHCLSWNALVRLMRPVPLRNVPVGFLQKKCTCCTWVVEVRMYYHDHWKRTTRTENCKCYPLNEKSRYKVYYIEDDTDSNNVKLLYVAKTYSDCYYYTPDKDFWRIGDIKARVCPEIQ